MKPVIIIPTLNENRHIIAVIMGILKEIGEIDVLVIDGCSTDGTVESVRELSKHYPNVSLLQQKENSGFGGALILGFQTALDLGYDPIITMDGDRSHGPEYIKSFLEMSKEFDLVIGSRYINGVRVEGWKFRKLLFSKLANMFVSYLLVKPVWDFTSGYRCYSKDFLKSIKLNNLHSAAYMVQIQLLGLAFYYRYRVKEIPFIYRNIYGSVSKIGKYPKYKVLFHILKYRAPVLEIIRHLTYLKKDYKRFVEEYDELINPPKLKNNGEYQVKDVYSISVGVMAYNEEKIIGKCLDSLMNQKLRTDSIVEIVVVSSGSTDSTDQIVSEFEKRDNRIRLITQPERLGKANAINEFLKFARGDIAIIISADVVPEYNAVQELVKPFTNADVGMTGAHPVPINDKGFVGFCVSKLWQLHHYMALDSPKCGEMVAFRNILTKIPNNTAVDEATMEGIFTQKGLKLDYAENAIVYNKGPETIRDFIKQRRRIASGHRHLKALMGHEVSTQNPRSIFKYVLKYQRWAPKEITYTMFLILIEGYSRFTGIVGYYLKDKNPFIWDIAISTKRWE